MCHEVYSNPGSRCCKGARQTLAPHAWALHTAPVWVSIFHIVWCPSMAGHTELTAHMVLCLGSYPYGLIPTVLSLFFWKQARFPEMMLLWKPGSQIQHACFPGLEEGEGQRCSLGGLGDMKVLCEDVCFKMSTSGQLRKLSHGQLQHWFLKARDQEFLKLISYWYVFHICVSPAQWIIASQIFYVLQLNFFFDIKDCILFLCNIFLRVTRDR